MRAQLITQVSEFLEDHESAPSAWCLVKSFHDDIDSVSDADVSMAYERSEGVNDTERDVMLNALTDVQLMGLAATIIEISMEKFEE